MEKLKAWIAKVEKTKFAEQVFRVVRIAAVTIAASVLTGSPIGGAMISGAVEGAFRQVFPVQAEQVDPNDPKYPK